MFPTSACLFVFNFYWIEVTLIVIWTFDWIKGLYQCYISQLKTVLQLYIKKYILEWPVWLSWLGIYPTNGKSTGSIPIRATDLGCGSGPQSGCMRKAINWHFSLTSMTLFLSFSLPSSLSKIKNEIQYTHTEMLMSKVYNICNLLLIVKKEYVEREKH